MGSMHESKPTAFVHPSRRREYFETELQTQVTLSPIFGAKPFIGCSSDSRPREERSVEEVYGPNGIQLDEPIKFVISASESDVRTPTLEDKEQSSPILSPTSTPARTLRKRYQMQGNGKADSSCDHQQKQNAYQFEDKIDCSSELIGSSLDERLPGAKKRILQAFQSSIKSFSTQITDSLIQTKGLLPLPLNNEYFEEISCAPIDPYSVVEYDMDLEGMLRILSLDAEWLRLYNEQHADAKAYTFTENDFEAAIDAFEKEWHSLEEFNTEVSDDSCCDVCGSPDASNANAIIFCDRCDMAVHQECYGVPSIPEGRWLCTKCGLIPNSIVNCTLCPHYEGAIKPTDDGGWAHIACAHYIEETGFSNETYLEPITGISQISPARLKLKCFLCKIKHGAPIQCSSKHCNVSFHVRCAQLANLSMDYMHKRTYCPRHTPNGQKDRTFNGIELNAQGTMPTEPIQTVNHQYFVPKGFKVEGASSETLPTLVPNIAEKNEQPNSEPIKISQMPPVSPEVIFSRIRNGEPWKHDSNKFPWKKVSTESSHQFEHFLRSVARYWSLKRDFKGVSLIRRLYLENSSPSSSLSEDVLEEITQRLRGVRFQLEMIRSLVELNKRLFELKLKDLQQIGRISNLLRVPTYHEQKDVLQKLKSIDKQKYFREPVSVEYAPDYLDIIENPMDFATIEFKLTTGKYLQKAQLLIPSTSKDSVHQQISSAAWELFKKDFDLICFNATTYNGPKTRWYKAAQNLNALGTPLIEQRQKASLCFLKEAIDWMQSPISEYLQVLCHQLCPYSKLPIEELFDEQKYGSSYKKSNPYSLIDVEY